MEIKKKHNLQHFCLWTASQIGYVLFCHFLPTKSQVFNKEVLEKCLGGVLSAWGGPRLWICLDCLSRCGLENHDFTNINDDVSQKDGGYNGNIVISWEYRGNIVDIAWIQMTSTEKNRRWNDGNWIGVIFSQLWVLTEQTEHFNLVNYDDSSWLIHTYGQKGLAESWRIIPKKALDDVTTLYKITHVHDYNVVPPQL